MSFEGQIALVTGASRGIGRAIASAFGKAGAYVIVNYRGNEAAAQESLAAIESAGGRGELCQFDVAEESQIDAAAKKVVVLMRVKPADWDEVVGTNLKGTVLCTKIVSRYMIRQHYGRIVNLSSVVGQTGNVGQSLYAASKAGVVGFTKSLAREVASRKVTVNAVAPGFIESDMAARLPEKLRQEFLQSIPLGRFGTCEEVAEVIVFLAGEKAGYITGQVFNINGGLYM